MGLQVKKRHAEIIFKKLVIETVNCQHHQRGFVSIDGKKIFPVHYSNGRGDMPGNIGKRFQKSLRINEKQFCDLRDCNLSAKDYYEIIKKSVDF